MITEFINELAIFYVIFHFLPEVAENWYYLFLKLVEFTSETIVFGIDTGLNMLSILFLSDFW